MDENAVLTVRLPFDESYVAISLCSPLIDKNIPTCTVDILVEITIEVPEDADIIVPDITNIDGFSSYCAIFHIYSFPFFNSSAGTECVISSPPYTVDDGVTSDVYSALD